MAFWRAAWVLPLCSVRRAGRALGLVCLGSALVLAGCGSVSRSVRSARSLAPAVARPAGTLYLSSTQFEPRTVTIIDAGTARLEVRRLSELSPGDPPYTIAVIDGQVVLYGRVGTYRFGAGVREPGRLVGASQFFIPSASPGRVWLVLSDRGDPGQTQVPGSVREVTVGGKVILAASARPPSPPVAAVSGGLLLQAQTLEVWRPDRGRIVRKLPGVFPLATRRSLVISCSRQCPVLHLTNVRTGSDAQIRPGPGFRFVTSYDGAFSSNGRLVAVPATTTAGHSRVAVIDIARRAARLVPGPGLAHDYTLIAWASTGWLFYNAGHGHLAAYRPGTAKATLLPLRVQPFQRLVAR